jgi:hypothetical protein
VDVASLGAGGRAFKSPRPDQILQAVDSLFLAAANAAVDDFVATDSSQFNT